MRYQQIFRILNLKIYERIFKYISVDPHAGLIFMQFILPGGAASRGHALPLHWLLKNQVSGIRKPTRGRHVSKESAESWRRLEERGASCLVSELAVGDIWEDPRDDCGGILESFGVWAEVGRDFWVLARGRPAAGFWGGGGGASEKETWGACWWE